MFLALYVRVEFILPRPKSVKRIYPAVKPDLDKLVRAVLDGLWPAWGDDAQVVGLLASKRYCGEGELPGVWVEIESIDGLN